MPSVFLPPDDTRLVTIIAHVDHGKTTLADNLIEHNGIISERLAGTLRYLDSDPEEQRRGITMRSSAIGLQHQYISKPNKPTQPRILHLLDSPGHTDFSMEVSSALVACDSCLLVLDAVEGMAPRTHQVLREAYVHRLVPILVVNKIDRLCTDLCLTPTESYLRLRTLLETVNAAASAMLTSAAQEHHDETEEEYSKLWAFDPACGNVIFASALFGWGFTCQSLARSLYRQEVLPIKPIVLKSCLFSDTRFNGEKLLKWNQDHTDTPPLFAEYALQPLWTMYEGIASAAAIDSRIKATTSGMEEVLAALQEGATGPNCPATIESLQQVLTQTGATSEDDVLRTLLRRYRPLAGTVLDTVCEHSPSPAEAVSSVRSDILALQEPESTVDESSNWKQLQEAVKSCDTGPEAPAVAHVCKFMATDRLHIRDADLPEGNSENLILGLARVLSGCLKTGDTYHLYGPKYKGTNSESQQRKVRLYLLMGSSFVKVDQVPAGHLCAIYNLEGIAYKTVTLSDSPHGMPVRGFLGAKKLRPLVKVHVEPEEAADTDALERGLVKLSLADAAVEVTATAKGERILACLGELHLEQSILDLEKVYCGKEIKLRISDPIVDFGETTSWFENETDDFEAFYKDDKAPPLRQMNIPPYNEEEGIAYAYRGRSRAILSGRGAAIRLRVVPLVPEVHQALREGGVSDSGGEEVIQLGRALGLCSSNGEKDSVGGADAVLERIKDLVCALDSNGNALIESPGLRKGSCVKQVDSTNGEVYVPKKKTDVDEEKGTTDGASGEVVSGVAEYTDLTACIGGASKQVTNGSELLTHVESEAVNTWTQEMKGSAVAGFQMALRAGWICEEPVRHVMVILEGVEIAAPSVSGGLVVSALRTGIRSALLSRPARLMEGHLRLTLHASLTGVGALYSVLNKRRGKVLDDSMVDGTDLLLITALIPQAESFGLAPELLRKTSGEVTAPELIFSHWELLDVDPFWIPTSEEEREDFGELQQVGDSSTGLDNTALHYIRRVRERKGLMVDSSRTVVAAEKQRTLKR